MWKPNIRSVMPGASALCRTPLGPILIILALLPPLYILSSQVLQVYLVQFQEYQLLGTM